VCSSDLDKAEAVEALRALAKSIEGTPLAKAPIIRDIAGAAKFLQKAGLPDTAPMQAHGPLSKAMIAASAPALVGTGLVLGLPGAVEIGLHTGFNAVRANLPKSKLVQGLLVRGALQNLRGKSKGQLAQAAYDFGLSPAADDVSRIMRAAHDTVKQHGMKKMHEIAKAGLDVYGPAARKDLKNIILRKASEGIKRKAESIPTSTKKWTAEELMAAGKDLAAKKKVQNAVWRLMPKKWTPETLALAGNRLAKEKTTR
jgi:hypothetical protein